MRYLPGPEQCKAGFCLFLCVVVISLRSICAAEEKPKDSGKGNPSSESSTSPPPTSSPSKPADSENTKDDHFFLGLICLGLIFINLVLGLCLIQHMRQYAHVDCEVDKKRKSISSENDERNRAIDTLEKDKINIALSLKDINQELDKKKEDLEKASTSMGKLEDKLKKSATEIVAVKKDVDAKELMSIEPMNKNFIQTPEKKDAYFWNKMKWNANNDPNEPITMGDIYEKNALESEEDGNMKRKKSKNKRYVLKSSPIRGKKPKRQSSGFQTTLRKREVMKHTTSSESFPDDKEKTLNKCSVSYYDVRKKSPPKKNAYATKKMYLHELLNMLKRTWSKEKVLDKLKPLHLQPYRNKESGQQTNLLLCGLVIKDGQELPGMKSPTKIDKRRHGGGGALPETITWECPPTETDTPAPTKMSSTISFHDAVK